MRHSTMRTYVQVQQSSPVHLACWSVKVVTLGNSKCQRGRRVLLLLRTLLGLLAARKQHLAANVIDMRECCSHPSG